AEPSFEGRFLDLRGDIYFAQGAIEEARKAYKSAIDAMSKGTDVAPLKQLVQNKLDALGGA
ncbi:MAG: tetratricopeptide repeat protein, partial [Rhodocyclaceae bacterium]